MSDLTFPELLDRARKGDPDATEWLVREFEPEIRREAGFMLRRNRLARKVQEEDVCQSVIRRLFVGLYAGSFKNLAEPADVAKLVKRMVKNRVVDWGRYWETRKPEVEPDPDTPWDPLAAQSTASQIATRNELVAEFERRLSPEELKILALRRQNVGWAEVVAKLGTDNAEATRKRFERAINRVCKELDLTA
jgi:DNA-directed RNA polymerase specialized sigma24 family protein